METKETVDFSTPGGVGLLRLSRVSGGLVHCIEEG